MSEQDAMSQLLEALLSSSGKSEKNEPTGEKKTETDSSQSSNSDENSSGFGGLEDLFGGIDIETILRITELFSQMNKPDKNSDLLLAIKPHLRPENQKKIDNAMSMLKIMSLLPLLKESGFLNDIM